MDEETADVGSADRYRKRSRDRQGDSVDRVGAHLS